MAAPAPLELNVGLKYFNTSSSKVLIDIFETPEDNKVKIQVIVVNLYQEDDEELFDLVEIEYELREI
ncbi:DUF1987 domain-containing protein [Flavobacteriales bacterium]|nr:DUF1987 domain-containing protein [Flavobacteriales bacterium]